MNLHKFPLVLFFLLLDFAVHSQNLVPNPGFENTGCPTNFADIGAVSPWYSPSNATPDSYHPCAKIPGVSSPNNWHGNTNAHSGVGYAGIITDVPFRSTASPSVEYREYLQIKLKAPLKNGKTYKVSYYIIHSKSSSQGQNNFSKPSAYISNDNDRPHSGSQHTILGINPQITANGLHVDSLRWTEVSNCYKATGGEQYITIGNFNQAQRINNWDKKNYFFIDDVSIIEVQMDINLGRDTILCQGEKLKLDASMHNTKATYLWQDNSTQPTFNVNRTGTYWVEIKSLCETIYDTIEVDYYTNATVELGNDTTLCQGKKLTLNATTPNATYLWQDNSTQPTFNVDRTGTYWVKVQTSCETIYDTIKVNYHKKIKPDLGNDTTLCQGETLKLNVTNPNSIYLWQNNSTLPTFNVTKSGTYWVETKSLCETIYDTIEVDYYTNATVKLGNDTTLCQGKKLTLNATTPNATYLWQDNSTKPTYNVTKAGTYWVKVQTPCDTFHDTIKVNYHKKIKINLGNDTTLCQGKILKLNIASPNTTYLWNNKSTLSNFSISKPGTYWIKASSLCETVHDTIKVDYYTSKNIHLGKDTTLCPNENLTLNATTANATYLWQDNSTKPTYNVTKTGTYWVKVETPCETFHDTIKVHYTKQHKIDLGHDTLLCPNEKIILNASTPNSTYKWSNNSTLPTFIVTKGGLYKVKVFTSCGILQDSISVVYSNPFNKKLEVTLHYVWVILYF